MKKIAIILVTLILVSMPIFSINVTNDVYGMTQINEIGWHIFPVGSYMHFSLTPRLSAIEGNTTDIYLDLFGGYGTGTSVAWSPDENKKVDQDFGKIHTGWKLNYTQGFLKNKFGNDLLTLNIGNKTDMHIAIDYIGEYIKDTSTFPITNTDFKTTPWYKELYFGRQYLTTSFYAQLNFNYTSGKWGYTKGVSAYIEGYYGLGNLLDIKNTMHHYGGINTGITTYFPIYRKYYKYKEKEYNLIGITFKDSLSAGYRDGDYVPSYYFSNNIFNISHSSTISIMGPHILMYDTYPSLNFSLEQSYKTGYETNTNYNAKSTGSSASFSMNFDMRLINIVHVGYRGSYAFAHKSKWNGKFFFYVVLV